MKEMKKNPIQFNNYKLRQNKYSTIMDMVTRIYTKMCHTMFEEYKTKDIDCTDFPKLLSSDFNPSELRNRTRRAPNKKKEESESDDENENERERESDDENENERERESDVPSVVYVHIEGKAVEWVVRALFVVGVVV
jgi:hypothetical protein